MRRVWWLATSTWLVTSSAGCATIVNGGRQPVAVQSSTPGAEMVVKSFKGPEVYSGPVGPLTLSRDDQYWVTVTAAGYKERKFTITKSMSGWAFGNLIMIIPILWGVGIAVDAFSGGLWTLAPDKHTIALTKSPEPPPKPP